MWLIVDIFSQIKKNFIVISFIKTITFIIIRMFYIIHSMLLIVILKLKTLILNDSYWK
jgi:hypothetical protein